jgi:Major Facilitator Superfamily
MMFVLPLPTVLRPLAAGTFVSAIGNGGWYASWALFVTRVLDVPLAQAGAALTIAGVAGMAAATPLGHLADRIGPREVMVALSAVRAITMAGFLLADSIAALTLAASLMSAAQQGMVGVKTALVAGLTGPDERLDALASLRVLSHAGDALGAAAGALVIQLDTPAAYTALIAANAASFLAYARAAARLPHVAPSPAATTGPRLPALRDGPYVGLAAICGVLTLCWAMVSTALPLWVAGATDAPRAMSGIVVVISSIGIAALQVRATRAAHTPAAAARVAVLSGAALAASCVLFAVAGGPAAHAAALLLLAGGIAHVTGELLFVAASWGLSMPLMPAGRAGQYQGVFATGEAAALTVAPLLMTAVVVGWGQAGWLALGALFVLATLPAPAITRRALRARAPDPDLGPDPVPARSA